MASDRSRTAFSALVLPYDLQAWAEESTYTQAGAEVGVPDPQRTTAMVLESAGAQDGDYLEILAQRGGHPGPAGAGFIWRDATTADYRGWDVPTVITAAEAVETITASVSAAKTPHTIATPDGAILSAAHVVVPGSEKVRVYRRETDGTESDTDVYSETSPAGGYHPCLLLLPDARVLLFHWVIVSGLAQVRVWASRDYGLTWTLHQRYALRDAVAHNAPGVGATGHDVGRLRAAVSSGQIMLLGSLLLADTGAADRDVLHQWAADDGAADFELIETIAPLGFGEPLAVDGRFLVAALSTDASNALRLYRAGLAYTALSTVESEDIGTTTETWATASGAYIDNGDLAFVRADDGSLFLLGRQPSTTDGEAIIMRTLDGGETWEGMGVSSFTAQVSTWWCAEDTATGPRGFAACWHRGRIVVATNFAASPGTNDLALWRLTLGGYSTVTMPSYQSYQKDTRQVAWTRTWLPWDEPDALPGYTRTGAATFALLDEAERITTSGNSGYYTWASGSSPEEGLIVRATLKHISGGSVGFAYVALRLRLADASHGYQVDLRFSGTQVRLFDAIAAATIATVSADVAAGVQVLIAMQADHVSAWWRPDTTDEDRQWTEIGASTTLSDDSAAGGTSSYYSFGSLLNSTATQEWLEVHHADEQWTGEHLADGVTDDALFPRWVSTYPVYVAQGASIAATSGPAATGDSWVLSPRYRYPVGNLLLPDETSPRLPWRGLTASPAAAESIAWRLIADSDQESSYEPTIGLWLSGCTWRTATLEHYSGGSWAALADIDLATDLGADGLLEFSRTGSAVYPATSSATGHTSWIERDELVGGTVELDDGINPVVQRRITGNTEGTWVHGSGVQRRPVIYIADADPGDPTSGSITIWAPEALVVVHQSGLPKAAGFRLVIDSQDTAWGYHQAKALLGPVMAFVRRPSFGRSITVEPNYREIESEAGAVRRDGRGPARRRLDGLAFTEGIPTHYVGAATPEPPYQLGTTAASARALAALGGEPSTIAGWLRATNGVQPVVWAPYVPQGSVAPAVQILTRRRFHLAGLVSGQIRVEDVQRVRAGASPFYDGQLVRVGPLSILELR